MIATSNYPQLATKRLKLRQFQLGDAPTVKKLAGARELAVSTFLPHPYKEGEAEIWIMNQYEEFKHNRLVNFAIELKDSGTLIGSMGLQLEINHRRAQLGFWIGLPYWNKGYCTEAGLKVIAYGFNQLSLNRIYALHFASNPASGKVLGKIGMVYEGSQKQHHVRFGRFEDAELYGLLKADFDRNISG